MKKKIAHYVAKGLASLVFLFSATMYFAKYDVIAQAFPDKYGFPAWLVIPLAIAKYSGVITIWAGHKFLPARLHFLVGTAFAGFFFNTCLATGAHLAVGDGGFGVAAAAGVLIAVAWFTRPLVDAA
jgi:hypothetical protein